MSGWIKLHRKILDNPIVCRDSDYLAVWTYLLLNATHKEYSAVFSGQKITLLPGQLITGRKSISEQFNISESKVQRILKAFENDRQIEQQTSNKNRIISILSWVEYQDVEQQNEQPVNNKRTTTEQQVNTNKNVKNLRTKELKNKDIKDNTAFSDYTENDSLIETLNSFVEFRKKIKKPLTDNAIKLLLSKLDNLASNDNDKIAVLEQSILNGWQGVFALKTAESKGKYQRQSLKPQIPIVTDAPVQQTSEEEMEELRALARKLDGKG